MHEFVMYFFLSCCRVESYNTTLESPVFGVAVLHDLRNELMLAVDSDAEDMESKTLGPRCSRATSLVYGGLARCLLAFVYHSRNVPVHGFIWYT